MAKLNGHVSYLQTEKGSLKNEKNVLAEKLAMLQLHVQEVESKANRILELEAEVKSLRLSLKKLRLLKGKRRERQAKIAKLGRLIPVHCNKAVAEYKESQELKDLLQAARDRAIMEKFTEWSEHGYLDKPRMIADLLTSKGKAQDT